MQTINVKTLVPTNTKGLRVKAITSGGGFTHTESWEYAYSPEENFASCAAALKEAMKWEGEMVGGHTENGMVFVFTSGVKI